MAWETLKQQIAQVIKTNGNQQITGYVLQQELFRVIDEAVSQGLVGSTELNETIRKTLTLSSWVSYLPEGSDFTTASLVANTPTKVKIPTVIKTARDFAVVDRGGLNYAVQYQGPVARPFKIFMSTGLKSSTNNVTFNMYMFKNDVKEPGIGIPRKIGTGSDVGALAMVGEFVANPGDFLEIYLSVDLATTITFVRSSIIFTEIN